MDTEAFKKRLDDIAKQVLQLGDLLDAPEASFPKWAQDLMDKRICLGCNKPYGTGKIVRGLHEKCSQKLTRSSKRKNVSDAQAVQAGLIAPPQKGGRRNDGEMEKKLEAIAESVQKESSKLDAKKPKKASRQTKATQ